MATTAVESPSDGSPGLQLTLFSLVMFAGSYLAGSAPLMFSLSEEKLQRVSGGMTCFIQKTLIDFQLPVLGAGLLVGTALAVIVPEGVQTLIHAYSSTLRQRQPGDDDHGHDHHHPQDHLEGLDRAIGVSLVLGFLFMLLIDQLATAKATADSDAEGQIKRGHNVSWTTTLGLVVHAAADGIALGAAATTNQVSHSKRDQSLT